MQITSNLGQEIIKRVAKYTEIDINIMDKDGKIVASTDLGRIGEIHAGAVEVLHTKQELIIDEQLLTDYPGTKQGVNLPIINNENISGVVGVSGNPEEMYKFTGIILTAVEVVMEQLHIERQEYFQETQLSYWLQQLLHPSGFNQAELEEAADYSLQVNIRSDWRVIVLYGEIGRDVLAIIRREITSMKLNTLFTMPFFENEIIITIPASFDRVELFSEMLLGMTGKDSEIGVGETGFGLPGIRNSYMLAKQALSFAERDQRISNSADWELERLIAAIDENEYKRVSTGYEQSLLNLDEIYLETIDIFLHMNLSIKKTAEDLHVHRNTLIYRLDQIYKKVGLEPRKFHDACILKIIRNRQLCANVQK
ncbi:CdaR family transcriptional regulator [Oceanobacillus sp. CF4.6]|uniref:CdaR family transcriptional regulator n=1 Tax=Oceanobacillus sp. CF4.6 TaxID=3373080 RepID=UPI003EE5DD50